MPTEHTLILLPGLINREITFRKVLLVLLSLIFQLFGQTLTQNRSFGGFTALFFELSF